MTVREVPILSTSASVRSRFLSLPWMTATRIGAVGCGAVRTTTATSGRSTTTASPAGEPQPRGPGDRGRVPDVHERVGEQAVERDREERDQRDAAVARERAARVDVVERVADLAPREAAEGKRATVASASTHTAAVRNGFATPRPRSHPRTAPAAAQ